MVKEKQAKPAKSKEAKTKVTKVATKKRETPQFVEEEFPLRKGDTFLIIKNGKEVYYPKSTLNVLFIRNTANIEIPKGSEYTPPKGSKCKGC